MNSLFSFKEVLPLYRADALRQMRDLNGFSEKDARTKEDIVPLLQKHFSQEHQIKQTFRNLDQTERLLLAFIQTAGGHSEWDALGGILRERGAVKVASPKQRYSYSSPEWVPGSPLPASSTTFQDVLARLESKGLLLGAVTKHPSSTVLDFGISEFYSIPAEVWPHLPPPDDVGLLADPAIAQEQSSDAGAFSRELYILWSYIWKNRPSLLTTTDTLSKRDMKALEPELPYSFDVAAIKREDEVPRLYFQRNLLLFLDLIWREENLLVTDSDKVRERWTQPIHERATQWFKVWAEGYWWNELSHLPAVKWSLRYSSSASDVPYEVVEARLFIIDMLRQLAADREWLALQSLMELVRLNNRSFLIRSYSEAYGYRRQSAIAAGRYSAYGNEQSWNFEPVRNEQEGWLKVEREFIRLVLQTLHWLGLIDWGLDEQGQQTALRLNRMGRYILLGEEAPPVVEEAGARVVIQPNFHIVAFGPLGVETLLELERFAERLSADRAVEYQLTKQSVYRGQQSGLHVDEIISRLRQLTGAEVPQNVVRTLQEWQAQHERIIIRTNVSLLHTADNKMMDELFDADQKALHRLSPTIAEIREPRRVGEILRKKDLSPVREHNRQGHVSLELDEEGIVSFRHKVPDIFLAGRVQQLAEWDEARQRWRLTRTAVRRARDHYNMDAEAQLQAWKQLLVGEPPAWLEQRIKAWAGFYGKAKIHQVMLLELDEEKTLKDLRKDKQLARQLKTFKPKGPLVLIQHDDLGTLRELLADYGIEIEE